MILTWNDLQVAIAEKIAYNHELYFCLFLSSMFNYLVEFKFWFRYNTMFAFIFLINI